MLDSSKAVQKMNGIERQSARSRRVHHHEKILGPEVAISGVDIGYITKELHLIDLVQDIQDL